MIEVYVSLDLTKVFPEIFRGLSHTMFVQIGLFTLMKLLEPNLISYTLIIEIVKQASILFFESTFSKMS